MKKGTTKLALFHFTVKQRAQFAHAYFRLTVAQDQNCSLEILSNETGAFFNTFIVDELKSFEQEDSEEKFTLIECRNVYF